MLIFKIFLFLATSGSSLQQKATPCPDVFTYEPRIDQPDHWYGRIILNATEELFGIWIHIDLDGPVKKLVNWFGEASTNDNKRFLIKNTEYILPPGERPFSLRFRVEFDQHYDVPSLEKIRLNGRDVCRPIRKQNEFDFSLPLYTSKIITEVLQRVTERVVTTSDSLRTITPLSMRTLPCGVAKKKSLQLVNNYISDSNEEWPWHAAIFLHQKTNTSTNIKYLCGGTLISTKHILTAAHCVTSRLSSQEYYYAHVGDYKYKLNISQLDQNVQHSPVAKTVIHPYNKASIFRYDIAMLILKNEMKITDFVRPACLWNEDSSIENIVNKFGVTVGYTMTTKGNFFETLQQFKMPVVSSETCARADSDFFHHDEVYCAGYEKGSTICAGISGGGMVFPKTTESSSQTIWHLRGVISRIANPKQFTSSCDVPDYLIYVDVAKRLSWIKACITQY